MDRVVVLGGFFTRITNVPVKARKAAMRGRPESFHIMAVVMLTVAVVFFGTPLRNICAEEMFFLGAGFGDVGVRNRNEGFMSDSHNTAYSVGLGIDLDKEGSPFRLSFRITYLITDKDDESWDSASGGIHQENQSEVHGHTMEVHGYRMSRTCSLGEENAVNITPYLGGGLVYRRLKLERESFRGTKFPIPFLVDTAYSLDDQCIIAVGGMPEAGVSVEFPRYGVECEVHLGWAFLAAKSDINYQVAVGGTEEHRYTFRTDTSGSWYMANVRITKNVDSLSLMLGIDWERMTIDDESILLFDTSSGDAYVPLPELEVTQTTAWIGVNYPF
ncbi:MAG: hypothetical protein ACMUIL_02600 [bacterium]